MSHRKYPFGSCNRYTLPLHLPITNTNSSEGDNMNTSEHISIYAPKAEHGGVYLSIAQIRNHNEAIGHHFFSEETMEWFSSKVYDDLHLGSYFITSEMNTYATNPKREYTIRHANGTGNIDTVGVFGGYSSLRSARTALAKIEA